jgi:hypothetical protein
MLSIPHCLDSRLTDGGKGFSPTHWPRSTPQKHYFFPDDTACIKGYNRNVVEHYIHTLLHSLLGYNERLLIIRYIFVEQSTLT